MPADFFNLETRNKVGARKRIGELLIDAGIIRSEELPRGLQEAQERSLRLGEVLVMMRYVTSEDLEAVLHAQTQLEEGTLSESQAIETLKIASRHRVSFEEALERSNLAGPTSAEDIELEKLQGELQNAERSYGPQNREIGSICLKIGDAYVGRGNTEEAENNYRRALQIFERSFGQRNLKVASCLSKIANLHLGQQKYAEAETLYWRVLDITQSAWGSDHIDVANCHKSLARLLEAQGRLKEAEQFYMSSLRIMEKVGGGDHPEITDTIRHLASFWLRQGKRPERKRLGDLLVEADVLRPEQLQEALQKSQSTSPLGQTLVRLNYLTEAQLRPALQAQLLVGDGVMPVQIAVRALRMTSESVTFDQALKELSWDPDKFTSEELKLLIEAAEELMTAEVTLGFEHAGVAVLSSKLADLYIEQKKYAEAEPLYRRAVSILEKFFGAKDPEVAGALVKLAELQTQQAKYLDAERTLWRALEIRQAAHGQDHEEVANCLDKLADVQNKQANPEQAQRLYQSSVAIKEKVLGKHHSSTNETWQRLAEIYAVLDNYEESEAIYIRLLRAKEKEPDASPSEIAAMLEKLADVYFVQRDYPKAETQYELALEIRQKQSHDTDRTFELMEKYSILLERAGRSEESRKMMERAQTLKRLRTS